MSLAPARLLSSAEFFATYPETNLPTELIQGVVYAMSAPTMTIRLSLYV